MMFKALVGLFTLLVLQLGAITGLVRLRVLCLLFAVAVTTWMRCHWQFSTMHACAPAVRCAAHAHVCLVPHRYSRLSRPCSRPAYPQTAPS